MYDFQKRTMFTQKWILNLQDLPRSQNLETVPICIVWQYFPHDNIVCIHSCDEYMKSIDSGVCHRPWSILLWIVPAYSLTIEYQVVQYVPSISISEQFESILVTILQQMSFYFFEVVVIVAWSWYFVELLCRLICQLTMSLHTFLCMTSHVIRPMKKYDYFERMVIFSNPPAEIRDSNMVL